MDTIERRHFNTGFCFNTHPDIQHEQSSFVEDDNTVSQWTVRYKATKLYN